MFPLEGIRVLDLMTLSGYCGMELADYGAEVIKVESPDGGDPLRTLVPLKNGTSAHHAFRDRGKKSITLNLRHPEGKEIFKKLVATADVVLENFPPNTMEELGLGYQELSAIKPSLVYGRISAYGSTGEGANTPQYDLIAQAKSGVMHFTGFPENPPTRIGFSISERYAASFLSSAVCLAIYNARTTGEGQMVETTLCGSAIAISEDKVITYGATKEDPMRTGNAHPLINPYDILKCKDGYVAMGISSDAQWMKFCNAFNCPAEWTEDEKYCSNLVRGYHYFGDLRVKLEDLFLQLHHAGNCRHLRSGAYPGHDVQHDQGSAAAAAASGKKHDRDSEGFDSWRSGNAGQAGEVLQSGRRAFAYSARSWGTERTALCRFGD